MLGKLYQITENKRNLLTLPLVRAGSSVQFTPAAPQSSLKSLPLATRRIVPDWETCAGRAGKMGEIGEKGETGGTYPERAGENERNRGRGGECARNARGKMGEIGGTGETGGTCAERAGVRRWRSGEGGKLTEFPGGVSVSADEMADAVEADPLARVGIQRPQNGER